MLSLISCSERNKFSLFHYPALHFFSFRSPDLCRKTFAACLPLEKGGGIEKSSITQRYIVRLHWKVASWCNMHLWSLWNVKYPTVRNLNSGFDSTRLPAAVVSKWSNRSLPPKNRIGYDDDCSVPPQICCCSVSFRWRVNLGNHSCEKTSSSAIARRPRCRVG